MNYYTSGSVCMYNIITPFIYYMHSLAMENSSVECVHIEKRLSSGGSGVVSEDSSTGGKGEGGAEGGAQHRENSVLPRYPF